MSAPQTGWNRIQRSAQRQKPAAIGQLVRAYTLQTGRRAILDRCDQAARSCAYAKDGGGITVRFMNDAEQLVRAHTLKTGFDRDGDDRGARLSPFVRTCYRREKISAKAVAPKPKPDAIEDDPQARSTKRTKKQSDRSAKSMRICSLPRPSQQNTVNGKALIFTWKRRAKNLPKSNIAHTNRLDPSVRRASFRPISNQKITTRKIKETN